MTKRVMAAILIVATTMTFGPASAAAPDNDNRADAAMIDALPFSDARDMSEATWESDEMPAGFCGHFKNLLGPVTGSQLSSVWYRFEPQVDTTITIDPRGTDFVAVIGVYAGDGPDWWLSTEIACSRSDDVNGGVFGIDLAPGSYAIQVARVYEGDGTNLSFAVREGYPQLEGPAYRVDDAPDAATGDATVVAVIDSGISPYHWDFLASRMPQALDANSANDLPLDQPPHSWLPGFPDPGAAFASYRPLDLTLEEDDARASFSDLRSVDAAEWSSVQPSTAGAVNYHWVPDTKLIGAITFSPAGRIEPPPLDAPSHGHGVASIAAGNYLGTCPECLLVFLQILPARTNEARNQQVTAAINWALEQPWIDVVSSSQGVVMEAPVQPVEGSLFVPDFFEGTLDTQRQRFAAERGQTFFQAAGNGLGVLGPAIHTAFIVPNPTNTNSMMGPDWLVTVGGISHDGDHITGSGKPVDVAAPAMNYPVSVSTAGVGSLPVGGAGTSFATPAVAGTYAHVLYHARRDLRGPSRTQHDGVMATTDGSFECGDARPQCELADGTLTATELRARLFEGAIASDNGTTRASYWWDTDPVRVDDPEPAAREWQLMNQGHGSYFGRAQADEGWFAEVDRILDPILGLASTLERPAGERAWMIVDSYCRQEFWGSWRGGYYVAGETDLPGPDAAWPIRSSLEATCPHLPLPVPGA